MNNLHNFVLMVLTFTITMCLPDLSNAKFWIGSVALLVIVLVSLSMGINIGKSMENKNGD